MEENRIPQLIQDGVIDEKGWPKRQETLQFAPGMPPLHTSRLAWNNAGAPEGQPAVFQLVTRNNEAKDLAEVIVGNSFRDAEPAAFKLYPDILPIGPLVADLQLKKPVLAHGAVACFVSHCGWNSTLEGVRNGVPFLCWPYFTDQFQNESYICNVWRTGLAVAPGADGVVTKEELSGKVERVLGDDGIRERVGALRDAARRSIAEGGSSHQNLMKFVELLKK
ncbi:putative UDP-glucosyltransferase [Panicum miliaceum]|uniref:UDP-glucosyltransferase n=1 Tax=Panicum miliaceum TaxID=4540 RepID=A0A3L6TNM8_PANMI|nr:putative UDP-glucosyltransferase [Panicum miliaceum]